jgi:hypothetical protein
MTYQQAYEQSCKMAAQLKTINEQIKNLCWAQAQGKTDERQTRIDTMVAEYRNIEAQRRQIWEGVAA